MKPLVLLLVSISLLVSQKQLTVYVNSLDGKMEQLEREIVEGVLAVYNKKNKEQLTPKFVKLKTFKEGFDKVASDKNCIVINSITITDERKAQYDFTVPYLPVKNAILARASSTEKNPLAWQAKNTSVAFTANTTGDAILKKHAKSHSFKMVGFKNRVDRINALKSKKTDFAIGDNILSWDDKDIKILYEFNDEKTGGFGIMLPKGSGLTKQFNKLLSYYIRSPKFHQTTTRIFGPDITKYFKRNLK